MQLRHGAGRLPQTFHLAGKGAHQQAPRFLAVKLGEGSPNGFDLRCARAPVKQSVSAVFAGQPGKAEEALPGRSHYGGHIDAVTRLIVLGAA